MKKYSALLIALILAFSVVLSSCTVLSGLQGVDLTVEENSSDEKTKSTKTGSNSKSYGELQFIKDFFDNSQIDLNFDITNQLLTGKLSDFELYNALYGTMAFKNNVFYMQNEEVYLFFEDDFMIAVGNHSDYPASAQRINDILADGGINEFEEFFAVLDIESLLIKKNFDIKGNTYTLKRSVILSEIERIYTAAAGLYVFDEEFDIADFDELFQTIDFTFVKNESGLESVRIMLEGRIDSETILFEYFTTYNSAYLPTCFDFNMSVTGDEQLIIKSYANIDYDDDNNVLRASMKLIYDVPDKITVMGETTSELNNGNDNFYYDYNSGTYLYFTDVPCRNYLNLEFSIDYSKMKEANAEFVSFSYENWKTYDNYVSYAANVGMPSWEYDIYLELESAMNRMNFSAKMDSTAQSATLYMIINDGRYNHINNAEYKIKFSTSLLKSIPNAVTKAKDAAKKSYK